MAQMAATLVLEPIFEADFRSSSYGFRPKRSATQALKTLRLRGACGGNHVLDADIRDYFGSIDHAKLLVLIGQRISDRRVLKLLRQWLAAGVMEAGQWTPTVARTPQGGVISPLLSNIYLHVLDRVWEDRCAHLGTMVRYADDFVALCDTKPQVEEARRRVSMLLTRLGLELHPEKTRMVDLSCGGEGFDFLACHLRKRMSGPIWERTRQRVYYLQRWPSSRAMQRVRTRVRSLTPLTLPSGPPWRDRGLNRVIRGWGQYFRTGNAPTTFNESIVMSKTGAWLAPEASREPPSCRSGGGVAPAFLRSLGPLPPAQYHSVSGSVQCDDLKTIWKAVCGKSACTV